MAYNVLVIFFIILSIFDVFIIKYKKNKFLLLILSLSIYLFFFGFRGFIHWDWFHYYPNWQTSINFLEAIRNGFKYNENINLTYEIGYQIWMSVLKIFFTNWNSYLFFTTLIDIICLLILFYRYSPYPVFSILLFLGFGGIQIQLDLMRNFKAILLFLFSIKYLVENKKISYFFINILTCFIHKSSFFYLLICSFLKEEYYKYKKIIMFIFLFGIVFFIFSDNFLYIILAFIKDILINFKLNIIKKLCYVLDGYLSSSFSNPRGIGLGFIEKIFSFILFYIHMEKINKDKYGKIFFNIFLFYIFTYLYGSGVRIVFERLGLLFICSYWILYPVLLKNISLIKKVLIFMFLVSFCVLKVNYTNPKAKELYEYKNILWNKETYEQKSKIFYEVSKRYH